MRGSFFWLAALLVLSVWALDELDENVKDAYYKWFDMTRQSFDKNDLASKYRKVARQYHPDKNKQEGAEQLFYKINKAFDVLNDDKKRALYNRGGVKAVDESASFGGAQDQQRYAQDIFRKMFDGMFDMDDFFGGGGSRGRPRGATSQTELAVTLEDLFVGKSMQIEYTRTKLCAHCKGTGSDDPQDVKTCPKCKGAGAYIAVQQVAPGFIQQVQMRCDKCSGRGRTFDKPCSRCHGQRLTRESETVEISIPPGTKDGEVFRFPEMADEHPDRETGDLAVIIRTKENPVYQRDGANLYASVELTLRQALLGFKISLPQLDGEPLQLARSETTQNAFVERIPNGGMPTKGSSKRGDLFVRYQVVLPPKLSKEQRSLLEKALPGQDPDHDEL